MNPFKPKKKSDFGKARIMSLKPKRSKVCHFCKRQTVRLRGTPKGWIFLFGFNWICPDCQLEHPGLVSANNVKSK